MHDCRSGFELGPSPFVCHIKICLASFYSSRLAIFIDGQTCLPSGFPSFFHLLCQYRRVENAQNRTVTTLVGFRETSGKLQSPRSAFDYNNPLLLQSHRWTQTRSALNFLPPRLHLSIPRSARISSAQDFKHQTNTHNHPAIPRALSCGCCAATKTCFRTISFASTFKAAPLSGWVPNLAPQCCQSALLCGLVCYESAGFPTRIISP